MTVTDEPTVGLTEETASTIFADRYGWEAPPGLTFEQWTGVMDFFRFADESLPWAMGDCYNLGKDSWGQEFTQVFEAADMSRGTVYNYGYVARAYPRTVRDQFDRDIISWSHFREAAPMETLDERLALITLAEEKGWSARELGRYRRAKRDGALDSEAEEAAESLETAENDEVATADDYVTKVVSWKVPKSQEEKAAEMVRLVRLYLQSLADEMGVTFLP